MEYYDGAERIIESENLPVMETLHYLGFRVVLERLATLQNKKEYANSVMAVRLL